MENIYALDDNGLKELGKQVQECIREMMYLHTNDDRFPNMVRNLMCFENRENNSNEWVQANISLTYDPLCFNDDDCTLLYWLPPYVADKIFDHYRDGARSMVMLLMEAQVDDAVIDRLLEISGETLGNINRELFKEKK